MKRLERKHLKENELAHSIAAARGYVETRQKQLVMTGVGIAVVIAIAVGVVVLRQRSTGRADAALAAAMVVLESPVQPPTPALEEEGKPTPAPTQQPGTFATEQARLDAALPKLKAAADGFPDSKAGVTASYLLATALAEAGKHKDAIAAYDTVLSREGASLYGRMAKLGKADAQVRLGQYEPAIAIYKELAEAKDSDLPADAVLMQLARAYAASGNTGEAQKTFSRIVHEHPASPFSAEAGKNIAN